MTQADPKSEAMKQALKEALAETAFAEAIREGRQTERVERDEVFDVLEGRA